MSASGCNWRALRIAFTNLLRRIENLRPARGEDSYAYSPIYIFWGLTRLDLAFDSRTGS